MNTLQDYINQVEKETNKVNETLKLQNISFILIFIAHATISDATKELQNAGVETASDQDILQKVIKAGKPHLALKQIAEIMLLLLDRIFKIPSDWIKVLTPLILWMTLHTEDKILSYMFEICPELNQELSRLHQVVSQFIEEQYMLQKLKDDEDQQLKILDLMANTLLPDENLFIGFMPLKSYITSKKEVKTGVKCP